MEGVLFPPESLLTEKGTSCSPIFADLNGKTLKLEDTEARRKS